MTVEELLKGYEKRLFKYMEIEFRNRENYRIKSVRYPDYETYMKEEEFKSEKVKSYFYMNETIVILLGRE